MVLGDLLTAKSYSLAQKITVDHEKLQQAINYAIDTALDEAECRFILTRRSLEEAKNPGSGTPQPTE